ncbi:hypothetical protein KFE25_005183 [Diacronema lutheri]|uniref:Uncharacterized protein n=1 Tax=Diacronema lutheri TaxID=2081491 RepID=A0A8J5X1G4_DIALT|nr:hypothetical protein KFE25_005183 [Diacronema lutheri]
MFESAVGREAWRDGPPLGAAGRARAPLRSPSNLLSAEPVAVAQSPPAHAHVAPKSAAPYKLLAGGASSAASRLLLAPLEVIRTVQQAASPTQPPAPMLVVGRQLLADEGWRALLKGTRAAMAKSVPEYALRFGAFDALRDGLATNPAAPTLSERLFAGGCAGAVAQLAVQPLDVVKTRITLAPVGTYAGVVDCAARVLRREGASALFRGLAPSLVGVFPFAALEQGLSSFLKDALRASARARARAEPSIVELLTCGAIASSVATAATYPLHLVRTRVQASGVAGLPEYANAWQCARRTFTAEGPAGFYRGLHATLLKGAPSAALGWGIFELLCAQLDARS